MPDDPIQHMLQAALQQEQARNFPQAESLYRQILQKHPDHPEALHLLGILAHNVGQPDAAIQLIRRAISVRADEATFHRSLAIVLQSQHRFAEAADSWRRVAALQPTAAEAPAQFGALLILQGRHQEAIESLQVAAALDPNSAGIQSNLGSALAMSGRVVESLQALRRAVDLDPNISQSQHNLAVSLRQAGFVEEAEERFRIAIRLNPTHATAGSGLLLTLQYREHDPAEVFAGHQDWSRRNTSAFPPASASAHPNDRSPTRRLRIGYVSADFRQHSVGFFIEPILAAHDPAAVEVFCYSGVDHPDETTHRIQQTVAHWRNIQGLADDPLAEMIRHDQIDILIDLSGHTAGNRLLLFARKPAPIQVTYLGYPNTTGLQQIDYRITDTLADPDPSSSPREGRGGVRGGSANDPVRDLAESNSHHTETLFRLPRCAWCYQPPQDAPPITAPATSHITFGSFNNLPKLSPQILHTWAQILHALPTSRLILKSSGLDDPSLQNRCRSILNVDSARLTFLGKSPSLEDHLQTYNQIDIALDSYPYHGTTTTCDALWMGVPVVTLAGDRHVSRVGVSLLTAVGLAELIADSPARYVELALDLARDRTPLSSLRQNLRDRMRHSELTDAPGLARAVESAYRTMWTHWCGARG